MHVSCSLVPSIGNEVCATLGEGVLVFFMFKKTLTITLSIFNIVNVIMCESGLHVVGV